MGIATRERGAHSLPCPALWLRRLGRECLHSPIWLGRPITQPEDMVRLQEVIYRLKPGVIVETGIARRLLREVLRP